MIINTNKILFLGTLFACVFCNGNASFNREENSIREQQTANKDILRRTQDTSSKRTKLSFLEESATHSQSSEQISLPETTDNAVLEGRNSLTMQWTADEREVLNCLLQCNQMQVDLDVTKNDQEKEVAVSNKEEAVPNKKIISANIIKYIKSGDAKIRELIKKDVKKIGVTQRGVPSLLNLNKRLTQRFQSLSGGQSASLKDVSVNIIGQNLVSRQMVTMKGLQEIFNTYGDLVWDIFTEDNLQRSHFGYLTYLAKYINDEQKSKIPPATPVLDNIFNALKSAQISTRNNINPEWIQNLLYVYGDEQVAVIINTIREKGEYHCYFKGVLKDLENQKDAVGYIYPKCVAVLQRIIPNRKEADPNKKIISANITNYVKSGDAKIRELIKKDVKKFSVKSTEIQYLLGVVQQLQGCLQSASEDRRKLLKDVLVNIIGPHLLSLPRIGKENLKEMFDTCGDLISDILTEANLKESSFRVLTYLAKYTKDQQARFPSLAAALKNILNALKSVKMSKHSINPEWIQNLLDVYGDKQVKEFIECVVEEKGTYPYIYKQVLCYLAKEKNDMYPECVEVLQKIEQEKDVSVLNKKTILADIKKYITRDGTTRESIKKDFELEYPIDDLLWIVNELKKTALDDQRELLKDVFTI